MEIIARAYAHMQKRLQRVSNRSVYMYYVYEYLYLFAANHRVMTVGSQDAVWAFTSTSSMRAGGSMYKCISARYPPYIHTKVCMYSTCTAAEHARDIDRVFFCTRTRSE